MPNTKGSLLEQLESNLQLYLYNKAPQLPSQWQEVLVKFLPYLTILFVILSLPVLLAAFGLGAVLSPFILMGSGVSGFTSFSLTLVIFAISVVIEAAAIPGLFSKSLRAWYLLYYSTLINALYNFLTFNLVGFILGGVVSLYLLFQIKRFYSRS
jgi:hypothetical protein